MIKKDFFESIGLNDEQIKALTKAMENETRFRGLLKKAGVASCVHDRITAISDTSVIDEIGEKPLLEIIKDEWSAFIPKNKKG